MATPKAYKDYPLEYTELILRAMNKPIRISFETALQAKRFRNHLYAFRQAICTAPEAAKVSDELVLKCTLISFKIDGAACIVHKPNRVANITKALKVLHAE